MAGVLQVLCSEEIRNGTHLSDLAILLPSPRTNTICSISKKVEAQKFTKIIEIVKSQIPTSRTPPILQVYQRKRKRLQPPMKSPEILIEQHEASNVHVETHSQESSSIPEDAEYAIGWQSQLTHLESSKKTPKRNYDPYDTDLPVTTMLVDRVKAQRRACSVAKLPKTWIEIRFEGLDPNALLGLTCKVYWPLDARWYSGSVSKYNVKTQRHLITYEDGEREDLILSSEKIKFWVSKEDILRLNLKIRDNSKEQNCDELITLAAIFADYEDFQPGVIIWAKMAGHPEWPAIVLDRSRIESCKLLKGTEGDGWVPVQFFGTHDFARVSAKQAIPFLRGLLSSFHRKCKQPRFFRSLEEAKIYLRDHKLPEEMLGTENSFSSDDSKSSNDSDKELTESDEKSWECELVQRKRVTSNNWLNKPNGYRPVHVDWKDPDRCNVCNMDEEYSNNLFLQCDKCRMTVHCWCYGEQPEDGVLWLCNLCRDGAPKIPPTCCLCPVTGGAMKPTTNGRWAHLTCAIWIPETCLLDVKKMEPIDGLKRISRSRWKLLCSICQVPYGACIQCSDSSCYVAYHPLCARAAGLRIELEHDGKLHGDEDLPTIRLYSFCRRHKQPSGSVFIAKQGEKVARNCSTYTPPTNPSGCARAETYNWSTRRGRKEPEALAAASVKRLFVEDRPHFVSGYRQNKSVYAPFSCDGLYLSSFTSSQEIMRNHQSDRSESILSVAEKYRYMKETFRKKLLFGKSGIHGFGIFAKQAFRAGDMIIEYIGELLRPPVADIREHFIYNSLVGAGTYMFHIDEDRVVDATRSGSIAHLINHSCDPNCYSRTVSVAGKDHIIIFARRDIRQWEELTYDYRFFSEEKLACYCGNINCRGVVNDVDAEERDSKIRVPCSELVFPLGGQKLFID